MVETVRLSSFWISTEHTRFRVGSRESMHGIRNPKILCFTFLSAGAYFLGQAIAWPLVGSTSLKPPNVPPADGPATTAAWFAASTLLIAFAVLPIAFWIHGRRLARWAILAAVIYCLHTAGTAIELTVFTRFEGQAYLAVAGILPALACGLLTSRLNHSNSEFRSNLRNDGSLAWRLAVCWLAYPFVYFLFGSLIIPFVLDDYMDESSMLVIPPPAVLLGVLGIRSIIFLLPSIAVIERWQGSRVRLWLSLGWAHAALVGLAGLLMPNAVLSPALRLVHAVEITASSFAYSGILVLILFAGSTEFVPGLNTRGPNTGETGE